MSYIIHKSDGTTLTSVPENQIVLNAASVALLGRGATNYGAAHVEAFVHILENFSNTTPPAFPLEGQLWFDTTVGALKLYKSGAWSAIGTGGSGSGSADAGGSVTVNITTGGSTTTVIALIAGGQVVNVISGKDIPFADLPATITVANVAIPFAARFPNGLQGGMTLATDASDYIYKGHQPNTDQAIFAGGGSPFAATTFCNIGSTSVSLNISNNQIVSVFSLVAVTPASLPVNFTVNGVTMPFAAAFSNGLHAGLTMADGLEISISGSSLGANNSGVTLATVNTLVGNEATARASAITNLKAITDATYALASDVTNLISTFETKTGTSSLSSAINSLVTSANSHGATADYTIAIKSQITSAISGAASFADALTKINASVTDSSSEATAITDIKSKFVTGTGAVDFATAVTQLTTNASAGHAASSAVTSLSSQLTSTTGQATTATAIQSLWTSANTKAAGWNVTLNGAGNVAGLSLNTGAGTKSNFTVQAEDFVVAPQTGSSIVPFQVVGNTVYMNNAIIQDLTVGTTKVAPSAVVNVTTFQTASDILLPYFTSTTIQCTATIQQSLSNVRVKAYITCHHEQNLNVQMTMSRTGANANLGFNGIYTCKGAQASSTYNPGGASPGQPTYNTRASNVLVVTGYETNVPAGTYTFNLNVLSLDSEYQNIPLYVVKGSSLEVYELKR